MSFVSSLLGRNASGDKSISPQTYADLANKIQTSLQGGDSRNSAIREINSFHTLTIISDPVSLAWRPFFRFDSTCGLLADEKNINSALNYLKRIGETQRYQMLQKFITQLKMLSSQMTYVFQEIDGLDNAYKIKPWESPVANEQNLITIKTLETVDFKIQSLMSMYRDIWFDYSRMAEVLPANLRRFDISIFVYAMGAYRIETDSNPTGKDGDTVARKDDYVKGAIPNIHSGSSSSDDSSSGVLDTSDLYVKAPDLFNNVVIDFSECEFCPWESGAPFFSGLSNKNTAFLENNEITFSYRFIKDRWRFYGITGAEQFGAVALMSAAVDNQKGQKFNLLDKYNNLKDKAFNNSFMQNNPFVQKLAQQAFDKTVGAYEETFTNLASKYGSLEALQNTAVNFVQGMAQNAVDALTGKLMSKINAMYLGNVYDWNAGSIIGALGSDNLAGAVAGIAGNSKEAQSLKSINKLPDGANVYNKM